MPPARRRNGGHKAAPPQRPPLPKLGDPLVTADGEIIYPDSLANHGIPDPQPLDVAPKDFRAITTRDMADFAAEPRMVVACSAILTMTMLGISDREIMETLKFSEEQLSLARNHDVYVECFNACYRELINANSASLQARIAGYAHGALSNVVEIARSARRDDVRLAANRDILDRAGTKASDNADREKSKISSLRIAILKDSTTIEVSDINV